MNMNDLRLVGLLILIGALGLTCGSCNSANKNNKRQTDSISSVRNGNIDYNKIGNQLLVNERIGDLKIGLSVAKTIDLLGEPNERTKKEIWGADGEYHHTMIYKDKGIEIEIVGESDSKQKIALITVTEPCLYKTIENIGIGADNDAVRKAYKDSVNPEFSDSNSIVVGSIYGGLIFKTENNKVKKIILGATAE
jgi:hypothetical protein